MGTLLTIFTGSKLLMGLVGGAGALPVVGAFLKSPALRKLIFIAAAALALIALTLAGVAWHKAKVHALVAKEREEATQIERGLWQAKYAGAQAQLSAKLVEAVTTLNEIDAANAAQEADIAKLRDERNALLNNAIAAGAGHFVIPERLLGPLRR